MKSVEISRATLDHYNRPGPRYTSYPTVPFWSKTFDDTDYRKALTELAARPEETLSLYVHLPFCAERCHYCGCNAFVTRREAVVDAYLDRVEQEIMLVLQILGRNRPALQLHWGGGTPNFLTNPQIERLSGFLNHWFELDPQAEVSIEIDPRIANRDQLTAIRNAGFNRISLGVQDFEPAVQEAIGRIQPREVTQEVYTICRELAFDSVNFDLIYGLPAQTPFTFRETLQTILEMNPDRIACYSYAHLPNARPNQKWVDVTYLPNHYEKFGLFQMAVEMLTDGGYAWIGMDHFARQNDELAVAAQEHRLHRNFMGYTVQPAAHMLAFGTSAIGDLAGRFVQNDPKLGGYQRAVDAERLPAVRGLWRSHDDELRRFAITHLMCNMELPYALTVEQFGADLHTLLPAEMQRLADYEREGLVVVEADRLAVTTLGRYFVRILGMELDAYLHQSSQQPLFSKAI